MQHSHHQQNNSDSNESWLSSRTGIATLVAVLVLGFLLYTGHGAHLLGWSPFLLILACPLMHIFMHGGHGGHGSSHNKEEETRAPEDQKKNEEHSHGGHH